MSRLRTVIRAVVLALVFTTIGAVVSAPEALASPSCVNGWTTEQEMAEETGYCRDTWMVDPGVGQFLSRAQLLTGTQLYAANGLSRQFLWYAPTSTVRIGAYQDQLWSSCPPGYHYGGNCSTQLKPLNHQIQQSFGHHDVTLSTFGFAGRHIARLCGNYFVPQNTNPADPVPTVRVEKFDDRDRDGTRSTGEAGLAGWSFRVERLASTFGDQNPGNVTTVTTGGDGALILPLHGIGPGTYQVEEIAQDGWAATTPARRTFVVADGVGDSQVADLRFGNAQTRADLVKVAFDLVDPPSRLETHTPATITVRAVITNQGPADVTATEALTVHTLANEDCTISPTYSQVVRYLRAGESATVDFDVTIRCELPSFHPMIFTDHLTVTTPGVQDPDPANNTVAFEHIFPVFGQADVRIDDTTVTCPARGDVGVEFTCTLSAAVSNAGPFGPVDADVAFTLQPPADCTATDVAGSAHQSVPVTVDEPRTVTSTWHLTCGHRSFHPISATATAVLNTLHVEDPVSNNTGAAATQLGIFEPVDLSIDSLDVRCTEREASTGASTCTAQTVIHNAGPATEVRTRTTLAITTAPDCTATPPAPQLTPGTLNAGTSATVTATWQLTCATNSRHGVTVTATVKADEPHAEDLATGNDTTTTVWGPADIKPRSLPSSINLKKEGVIPFAVLSTATLDATTAVERTSLRFGRTGTENSVTSCAPTGEDVNDDGRLDLICRAETQMTGITCHDTVALITGRLINGTRFQAEDTIKVVGCQ